jgi:hypothetical protein
MWTEKDDLEIPYGEWLVCDLNTALAETDKICPPKPREHWPHWNDGVPTKLCVLVTHESFFLNGVHHRNQSHYVSVELEWNDGCTLSELRKNPRPGLPGDYKNEWNGVYRIYSMETVIPRVCGQDHTGTLYVGQAGSGRGKWSTLRTRISSIANGDHHAIMHWRFNDAMRRTFPTESLAVEWAYLNGSRYHKKGVPVADAIRAEGLLLGNYRDSFGELPPWNHKG